jgi:acyl-coenzyme A synthetase/AMP-(fatty) acid ligase
MPQSDPKSLRDWLWEASSSSGHFLWGADASVSLAELTDGSSLRGGIAQLAGRSVLLATGDQLTTALALLELDGVARRITLCPPDLRFEHIPSVIAVAAVDAIVTDRDTSDYDNLGVSLRVGCSREIAPARRASFERCQTEWMLLTSGTTGGPKVVMHGLASLTAAIDGAKSEERPIVWGTFYDIRRYGGLQIFLRAILGGASLVLSSAREPTEDHLARLGAHAVTHISGTPSHWRRTLMSASPNAISPRYVRLSGEIADQTILDGLRACYPGTTVAHAYASTEAGVAFEVEDGREGFPAALINKSGGGVNMKIVAGSLRIRSVGTAVRYVGSENLTLADSEGFVDTGDMVELRGDRYYFAGRRGGIINVGGLKVHPEEVEAVINRHPNVRMSLVLPKKNPITGSVVVADVVLSEDIDGASQRISDLRREILQICREELAQHKVPAAIRFVPALAVVATGKLARRNA